MLVAESKPCSVYTVCAKPAFRNWASVPVRISSSRSEMTRPRITRGRENTGNSRTLLFCLLVGIWDLDYALACDSYSEEPSLYSVIRNTLKDRLEKLSGPSRRKNRGSAV